MTIPASFRMTEAEYQATHVLDGMAYRLRDEFVSDETKSLLAKWERSMQIQDPDGIRRNGKALTASQRDDQYRAVMSIRSRSNKRFAIVDGDRVVGRSRSLAAAHRATRRANMAGTRVSYSHLVVYPYRRVGQRSDSWVVATGDRPGDVVHRTNSKTAAITWARRRSADVVVTQ